MVLNLPVLSLILLDLSVYLMFFLLIVRSDSQSPTFVDTSSLSPSVLDWTFTTSCTKARLRSLIPTISFMYFAYLGFVRGISWLETFHLILMNKWSSTFCSWYKDSSLSLQEALVRLIWCCSSNSWTRCFSWRRKICAVCFMRLLFGAQRSIKDESFYKKLDVEFVLTAEEFNGKVNFLDLTVTRCDDETLRLLSCLFKVIPEKIFYHDESS